MRILKLIFALSILLESTIGFAQSDSNAKIWMTYPGDTTKNWESQVFHLGNGYFGASCYGGIQKEVFTLAEKTFWTGGPGEANTNDYGIIPPKDKNSIDKIKYYTKTGDVLKTDSILAANFQSKQNEIGGLSSIGNLFFKFDNQIGLIKNYKRTLDLKNSTVTIEYQIDDVQYKREYFCSYPDRVLAIRLKCDKPKTLNLELGMDLLHIKRNPKTIVTPETGLLEVQGNIDDNNRPYRVKIKVMNEQGDLRANNNLLAVKNATSVTIFYTIATNYRLEAPLYKGEDPEAITTAVITKASLLGFDKLLDIHKTDYQKLYGRTKLSLENKVQNRAQLPTNERLLFYSQKEDYQDLGLKELAFNFGKYILISATRPGTLSVGLQGAWNNKYMASWSGTNQLGVNVPQTYMFGNALNLSECQEPFINFTKNRAIVGKDMAKAYYNSNGWASFIIADIWGHTGILSSLELKFVSSAWLCLIMWEQYAFDQNIAYLKTIYPVLKGASQFFLENLVEYKDTKKLVFVSGVSNEHRSGIGAAVPNYQDIALISELFENTTKASEILNEDPEFRTKLIATRNQLMPFKVGRFGQLQEWVEDVDDPNCKHRHISQLLALQPCKQINPYKEPKLAEAIKVSLNYRGDADLKALNGVGENSMEFPGTCTHEGFHFDNYTSQVWCRAFRICEWLRVFDGDRADKIYNDIFRESTLENMIQYETKAHYNSYPGENKETPFFLDGITLSAGYVTEMVLQSQFGELDLLPSLPSAWESGSLKGIRARGGFTVDIYWKDGKLVKATVNADKTGKCKLRYNGKTKEVTIKKGKTAEITESEFSFN
jgi:alpha-L-fucosidase 2